MRFMVKPSTVRAEIARLGLKKWKLAGELQIRPDIFSKVINGKRAVPGVLERIWQRIQEEQAQS